MMQNLPAPFDLLPSSAIRNIELEQGEILFRQGDVTTGMFLLASAGVELRRVTEAGERLSIHHFSRGDTSAEASLFAERYHCEAVATASGQIVRFDKTALRDAFEQNPAFAFAIASRFAHQVQTYRRRLEILAIRGAERRVLNAVQEGLLETDIKSFAATIGLTHEATYRALAALVRQGRLVKPGRGSYRLPGNCGAA